MTPNSTYQSYLLRLWRDSPTAPWRALLQSTANGEKYHFAEVATLFAFLTTCLAMDAVVEIDRPYNSELSSPQ